MPYQRRKRRYISWWMNNAKRFWIILGVMALAGLWWWLTTIGPRRVVAVAPEAELTADESADRQTRQEIEALRKELLSTEGLAALAIVEEAIEQQRVLTEGGTARQADMRRLAELEAQRDTLQASLTNRQIGSLMERGSVAMAEKEYERASVVWQEALRLQQMVNRSRADSPQKNFVREGQLEAFLQEIEAEPLALEVEEALSVARTAMEEHRWADALAALTSARTVQLRLNSDYARSRHADLRKLDQIEREIDALDASSISTSVDEHEAAGDAALAAGDYAAAVKSFEEARQGQLRLNREFSRSRFLSSPRVEQLEVKRQTASSIPLLEAIRRDEADIDRLLLRREVVQAAERITAASTRLEEVHEQLGKSEALDAGLRLKLGYLATQAERLGEIQDNLYARIRPLPGVPERRLLTTEMPQAFYLQVMRVNPSRHAGRAFPVDSVDWIDAVTCCRRLSWILGRTVRLPTEDEFRIAVGDPAENPLNAAASATGHRASFAMAEAGANPAGYFDLLGNLAEWLQPRSDQAESASLVAGGSYLDDADILRRVPVETHERKSRSRHIGFRVLVEMEAGP